MCGRTAHADGPISTYSMCVHAIQYLYLYRVRPLVAKRFGREHFLAARGLAATRRRHGRRAGATARVTIPLDSRDSSPFALGDLKRAQAGWPGVTNSAQALQQCTVVSAAVHAALAHRDHAERLQWCRGACRECVAAHTRRADASLMLTATRCSTSLGLSRMDLGQRVVSRSRAERL